MITKSELTYTLLVALIIILLAAAYGLRVAVKGRAHFDRIDRQGGSWLLGKGAMELGYWILEPVARLLVFLGITPNQVSWASLGFGFLAGACLAVGRFGFGAVFATISGLLDSLDGMVARISGVASDAGEVLDAAVDRYVEFFFLSGLIIYYREIPVLQVLALLALLGSFMVSYSTSKAEALKVDPPKASMRRPERAVYLTLGAALSTVTIPWLETHREDSIAIAYPMVVALGLVAVVANVSSIERFWSIAKAIRVREKDLAEARTRAAENVLIEGQKASQASHQPAGIRYPL
jgi:CDP-diacylglycerol--glycerol-3-phosphate 3-phosphatidyltransferase